MAATKPEPDPACRLYCLASGRGGSGEDAVSHLRFRVQWCDILSVIFFRRSGRMGIITEACDRDPSLAKEIVRYFIRVLWRLKKGGVLRAPKHSGIILFKKREVNA